MGRLRALSPISRLRPLTSLLVVTAGLCGVSQAHAQSAEEVVQDLNRQAMEAYNNLDIEKAGSMLEEALRVAAEGGVSPPLMATTNVNMGVVYIGGLGDNDGGLGFFVQAICADPNVQLDPLTSTPDIVSVFQVAQQQARSGACPTGAGPPGPGAGAAPGPAPPLPPAPEEALLHHSPPEQLSQTPLPLYVEVDPASRPHKIYLHYKGLGMEQYKRVAMFRYQTGFAYQVSCDAVWEPRVTYYIEAQDEGGNVVGVAGSPAQPIEVPVVSTRNQGAPALPGAQPPESCAAKECPPGLKGCEKKGTAAIGDRCEQDNDCQSGLECADEQCVLIGAGGTEAPDYGEDWGEYEEPEDLGPGELKRFFVQVGLTAGLAYITDGMVADRPAPDETVFINRFGTPVQGAALDALINNPVWDPGNPNGDPSQQISPAVFYPPLDLNNDGSLDSAEQATATPWVPDADSFDSAGQFGGVCGADGEETGPVTVEEANQLLAMGQQLPPLFPSRYCVRVKSPGFVPALALRAAAGYFLTERISVAGVFRLQFSAGRGTLANMLFGARGEYLLTDPRPRGLMISGFLGGTFGQIQAKPPADGNTDAAPFVKSGLMGAHVGANLRYRISENFGVFAAPEIDVQFPTFLLNVDLTFLGVEAAF